MCLRRDPYEPSLSTVAVFVAGPNVYIMFATGKHLRIPMHAVIFSDNDWDVHSPPQHSLYCRFQCHYHAQEVIGSLGDSMTHQSFIEIGS